VILVVSINCEFGKVIRVVSKRRELKKCAITPVYCDVVSVSWGFFSVLLISFEVEPTLFEHTVARLQLAFLFLFSCHIPRGFLLQTIRREAKGSLASENYSKRL
jgi:hypothetical protein